LRVATHTSAIALSYARLKSEALGSGQMHQPITVDVNRARTLARIDIPLAGDGTNKTSQKALGTLRGSIVPETVGTVGSAYFTGATAYSVDSTAS
jgi:putative drug exporter of the RND superfamily